MNRKLFVELAMPFKVRKVKGGYKVASPSGTKSRKPMSKAKARRQQKAIYASYKKKR